MVRKVQAPPIPRTIALCYIRQSWTRNKDDMYSPERQRANCLEYCEARGWTPEFYEDADKHRSGTKETNRPGWLALKERLDAPEIVALVANDLSRLHRKGYRFGQLMEMCQSLGVELVLAARRHSVDLSDMSVKMYLMLEAMFAEYYAADISQKQKDSVAYRRKQGKTVGIPPFGTVRGPDGFLIPTTYGAWQLADGSYVAGHEGEEPPEDGAVWRGYYACAERILTLYTEGMLGYANIAFRVNSEGWAFRSRQHQPRPITVDDVRRVTGKWREYAGLVVGGRAKDKNASMLDNPPAVLFDTGRAVFSLELLRRVAEVQTKRSITVRPVGAKREARIYALTNLLYCAHCEEAARTQNQPALRRRLAGWNRRGVLRYRHADGQCSAGERTIRLETIEADVLHLISLLTIKPEALPLMHELALQTERGAQWRDDAAQFEAEKRSAIAKLWRKLDANRELYQDGEIDREEYLSRKGQYEGEIAHWETRTTETQQAALHLAMCLDIIDKFARLWEMASEDDRQGMAHQLFEYIVVDLETKRITDFRLKSWADQFLVLRETLYRLEAEDRGDGSGGLDKNEANENGASSDAPFCAPMGESSLSQTSCNRPLHSAPTEKAR